MTSRPRIILLLADQLSLNISSLKGADPSRDIVLMAEVSEEATYVRHHKKKIVYLFSAMRHFAEQLRENGWTVEYTKLDDLKNTGGLGKEVERLAKRVGPATIIVTEPGEWRLRREMETWSEQFGVPVDIREDNRFICTHAEFQHWASGRKQLRMEYFYREMRRKTGLLMDGDKPIGGKWNFDAENRKPARADLFIPTPHHVKPDAITRKVITLVEENFPDHFGVLVPFWFGVTREDALVALGQFVEQALPHFGDYQDAMLEGEPFLYHAVLGLYINAGLLDPLEVCQRVEEAYHAGLAPLNAAEGFIRQIIGWREYVRGIYWLKMPDYARENFFENTRPLPDFYWTGKTDMACMRAAIMQTKEEAYAHHIQRLMVTGNFALIAGIDPHEVHEWYLAAYADAYEWVELPNTLGMSQFADGGLLGSKPYAASGNYIHKMSDHCKKCRFDVKKKIGEDACPFNPLYWDFLVRNRSKLDKNPRMAQMFRVWDKMDVSKQTDYRNSAAEILSSL